MKLASRLWLSGALLPVLVMAPVLFVVDGVFVLALERSLDQALLAQAAVESVSLFDGPGGEPHLRMASSPLVESVRGFAPEGILFGPQGEEVMRYPPVQQAREREWAEPRPPGVAPVLRTDARDGARQRTLEVSVASPSGQPYMLRLTASMAQVEASKATLDRLSLGALLVIALVLAAVQTWQGRSLRRRLANLSAHAEALRAGDLEQTLAPEPYRDEVAALRRMLAQATTALRQARAGKERLLADAAHELRSPLTLMRTSLDLALRKERPREELRSALSDTRHEVDRLAVLATRLLDSAALAHRAGPPEICDLSRLLNEAVEGARPEAERRGQMLSLSVPVRLEAQVRPQALRQAVDNLLSNALKYAQQNISVHLTHTDACIVCTISDDGPGIPPAERELVFEPFHRLQHGGAGAGLGLAIVREVAHAHHGRAYVAPTERGATLVLELKSLPVGQA